MLPNCDEAACQTKQPCSLESVTISKVLLKRCEDLPGQPFAIALQAAAHVAPIADSIHCMDC